jgi:histidinol-phosphatase
MVTNSAHWLALLTEIADQADEIALHYFRKKDLRVDEKPDMTPVTEADRRIEESARSLCRARRPDLGICGEEEGETSGSSGVRLIIDPIDGTKSFVRGIPIFATLLAIEEAGEIVAGAASAPALRTRWTAARGQGAFCGERRLSVSGVKALSNAQVLHGGLAAPDGSRPWARLLSLTSRAWRSRGFGDFYQHLLVAEGSAELAVDPIVYPWDVAALLVIIEEAGGRATTLTGQRSICGGSLVTSNGLVHAEALSILAPDHRMGAEDRRCPDQR